MRHGLVPAEVALGVAAVVGLVACKGNDPCDFECPAELEKRCPQKGESASVIRQVEIQAGVLLDRPAGGKTVERLPQGTFLRTSGSCGDWERAVYPEGKTRGWLIRAAMEKEGMPKADGGTPNLLLFDVE